MNPFPPHLCTKPTALLSLHCSCVSSVRSLLSVHIITAMETLLQGQHVLFLSCRLHCQVFCLLSFLKIRIPPPVLSCLILSSLPSCCVKAFFLGSWHCPASYTAVALGPHTCQSFSSVLSHLSPYLLVPPPLFTSFSLRLLLPEKSLVGEVHT